MIKVSLLCIVRSDGLFFMIPKGENIGSCVSTGIRTWVNQLTWKYDHNSALSRAFQQAITLDPTLNRFGDKGGSRIYLPPCICVCVLSCEGDEANNDLGASSAPELHRCTFLIIYIAISCHICKYVAIPGTLILNLFPRSFPDLLKFESINNLELSSAHVWWCAGEQRVIILIILMMVGIIFERWVHILYLPASFELCISCTPV